MTKNSCKVQNEHFPKIGILGVIYTLLSTREKNQKEISECMKKHTIIMILICLLDHLILTHQKFLKMAKKLHFHNIKNIYL